MNLEEINKWLDENEGMSYTRLEELHDFIVWQNVEYKDKIDKAVIDIEMLIEIIQEQPSNDKESDIWLLDKLKGIRFVLKNRKTKVEQDD